MKSFKEYIQEAEYQGKTVKLNKPEYNKEGKKKFKVYVKNAEGKVIKIQFGDKNMEIKRDNPKNRKNFRARHKCDSDKPNKWEPRYWSCYLWQSNKSVSDIIKEDED